MSWRDHALFLKTFFRKPLQLGSLIPSTQAVADHMLDQIDWTGVRTVVELGAGVGPITAVVQQRKPRHVRFVAFEREDSFRRVLQERFPDVQVEVDARDLARVLGQQGVTHAEVIISAIPLSIMTVAEQEELLGQIQTCLAPGGLCLVLQFWPAVGPRLRRHFQSVTRSNVLLNVPPAYIFRCEKARLH